MTGRRSDESSSIDRLDGEWRPLADTAEKPFASWHNIEPAEGVEAWMLEKDKSDRGYGAFSWRLGLLTPKGR